METQLLALKLVIIGFIHVLTVTLLFKTGIEKVLLIFRLRDQIYQLVYKTLAEIYH